MRSCALALALMCVFGAQGADESKDLSRNSRVELSSSCPLGNAKLDAPIETLGPALLAAIVPSLISTGVDFVGQAIAAQAQSKTKTFVARGDHHLYRIEKDGSIKPSGSAGCLIAVIDDAEPDETGSRWGGRKEQSEVEKRLREKVKGEADKVKEARLPYLYFEALLQPTADRRYFRVVPKIVYFKKPLVSGWGSESREIVLTFTFAKPGAQAFASLNLPLGSVDADSYLEVQHLGNGTDWVPVLSPDDDEKAEATARAAAVVKVAELTKEVATKTSELAAIKAKRHAAYVHPDQEQKENVEKFCQALADIKKDHDQCAYKRYEALERASFYTGRMEARKEQRAAEDALAESVGKLAAAQKKLAEIKSHKDIGLVNIQVAVSETREASKFFEFLSSAFTKSKEEITTALKNDLIKSNRLAAQKAELDKENTAKTAKEDAAIGLIEAQAAVRDKEDALAALGSTPAASALRKAQDDLRIAKIRANQAARKAGEQTVPYPEVAAF